VLERLKREGLRAEIDASSQRMNAKIRDAQNQKIPYAFILGKREVEEGTVSVRDRSEGDLGQMTVEAFLEKTDGERAQGSAKALPALD
ncbi:MAG: His/Gly/Thr/Pro-type tRNA ligase C-terminal domain-containing protein, partial [Candidatus Hydrogenedentes bacterium]|nr:His/Gly/Thr/Pro-type tRNA ligase C-terminal domain-containing protein [Candidatus Hydrogenedentota bacterium]